MLSGVEERFLALVRDAELSLAGRAAGWEPSAGWAVGFGQVSGRTAHDDLDRGEW